MAAVGAGEATSVTISARGVGVIVANDEIEDEINAAERAEKSESGIESKVAITSGAEDRTPTALQDAGDNANTGSGTQR